MYKTKLKSKEDIFQDFFFIYILKFMDERPFMTCTWYTVTESVYSGMQMNKDNLTINNEEDLSLCYQDKAAIGRSLYLILNFSSILRSISSPCV